MILQKDDLEAVHYGDEIEARIRVEDTNGLVITANAAGYITLARIFLQLSKDEFAGGVACRLDDVTGLEKGSEDLLLERV